ncbi:YhgE/Pip-like protein [Kroppenstedtia sanguinis]|uniref:YhgE/Pip domain-containing protein n=1 Tax=Kroppenstedtia sanguinis TaxID=1380684 RepID=UPI003D1D32BB
MKMLKQKMMWLGAAIVLVVFIIFGAAMLGTVGSKPKELPVALVVLDQPTELPTGGTFSVGEEIREKLTSNSALPFVWHVVDSEGKARKGMDNGEYYGALLLPADLSSGLLSLATPSPAPPDVKIIVNEGMNTQASTVVRQGLGQAMKTIGGELSQQLLGQIRQKTGGKIPVEMTQALMTPVKVQEEVVHPPGVNNASGNAPGLLTQMMYIGCLVTAIVLFLTGKKAVAAGSRRWTVSALQAIAGLAIVGMASGLTIWMASSWYGMELAKAGETGLFLWLVGSAFFLLQSSLLNWIGFPAMPLLVLLMFFSVPLLNMAPEFLSQTMRDWIYSWTPLRFSAEGLREVMYFGGLGAVGSNASVLWGVVGVFLVLLLASGFKAARGTDAVSTSVTEG